MAGPALRLAAWLACLWLWLGTSPAVADALPPLVLGAETRQASLIGHIAAYVDHGGKLTIADMTGAAAPDFTPLPTFVSEDYSAAPRWYRFTLDRQADASERWILDMGVPYLDDIRVYVPKAGGGFAEMRLGDHVPFDQRPLQSRSHALGVTLTEPGPTTWYIRLQTSSIVYFHARIAHPAAFSAKETRITVYQGAYFGAVAIIIFLYLTIGLWLRESAMLAYGCYLANLFLLHLVSNGYVAALFSPDDSRLLDFLPPFAILLNSATGTWLWAELLRLKTTQAGFCRFYRWMLLLFCLTVPLAASPWFGLAVKIQTVAGLAMAWLSMGIMLWRLVRHGFDAELALYFIAFLPPIAAAAAAIAAARGLIAMDDILLPYQLSSFSHILLLSVGLAYRISRLQQEKKTAENAAMVIHQQSAALRRFVAMLSHEFRNPLAAIDRAAQMIGIKVPELAARERQRLEAIRGQAGKLTSLVDRFLVSEALEHQSLALTPRSSLVRAILDEAIHHAVEENELPRLSVTVTPTDMAATLDPDMMVLAIGNLLSNALRYSPADSQVQLTAARTGEEIIITVADRGRGMGKEELEQLGTPFFRAKSSAGSKGSGLGFHLCQRIVAAHGGSVAVDSELGNGTTVTLRLRAC